MFLRLTIGVLIAPAGVSSVPVHAADGPEKAPAIARQVHATSEAASANGTPDGAVTRPGPVPMVQAAENAGPQPRYHLTAQMPLAPGKKVGSRRAGLACLPAGSVNVADFLVGPEELLDGLQRELARNGLPVDISVAPPPALPQLVVRLDAIKAKLCASSWGLGDMSRVKGTVAFTFVWHDPALPQEQRAEVVIDTKTAGARLRTTQFLPLALVQLSARISPPPG